jgi:hypothetical protein
VREIKDSGALELVVNAIVVWNACYIEAALILISEMGEQVEESDVQCISPFGYEHIDIVGRYSFVLPEEVEKGYCVN